MWEKTFRFFVDAFSNVERSRVHARVIHPVFWEPETRWEKKGNLFPFRSLNFLSFPLVSLQILVIFCLTEFGKKIGGFEPRGDKGAGLNTDGTER